MTWIMVDVETDGPCPGLYSMVSFGAVVVEPRCATCYDTQRVWDNGDTTDCRCVVHVVDPDPRRTFYGECRPISNMWIEEALAVSKLTRAECMRFPEPEQTMRLFAQWLDALDGRLMFVSDNNGFDWQFINYYFHLFCGRNPFGHSSTNLGSLYKGLVKNTFLNFKHLRQTKHTHHPVDDAKGNAEAMLHMVKEMGLKTEL